MELLVTSPVGFINGLSVPAAKFVIFCGTTLGGLAVLWAVAYIMLRPLPKHGAHRPLRDLRRRILNLGLVFVSVGWAYLGSVALKNYFKIGRPDILNFDLTPLLKLTDYGFPSGHATFYSALAVSVFFIERRAGVFLGLVALTVGAARIVAGVHTPLDIVGGYLLGIFTAALVDFLAQYVSKKSVAK